MRTARFERPPIDAVIDQHAADLAAIWSTRQSLETSARVALRHLHRFDRRLAAHENGCLEAGRAAMERLAAQLPTGSSADVFALAVVALGLGDQRFFLACVSLAETVAPLARGLEAAIGWVPQSQLHGMLSVNKPGPVRRLTFAACRLHAVDPGPALAAGCQDPDSRIRAEGFRAAGALGIWASAGWRDEHEPDDDCMFWKSWAAVMCVGQRVSDSLCRIALSESSHRDTALYLALQVLSMPAGHDLLRQIPQGGDRLQRVLRGSGIVGDPAYVPWLVQQMQDQKSARGAGEAFTLITGADLALLDLERKPPEDFESGPNDNPDDPNVDMDPDDGLPWPEVKKVEAWWHANEHRFQKGTRYFMGAPVSKEHCIHVLKTGYQRQRILAAHYLCLLEPGTPLFNTSAPAWRQQRLLAAM